MEWKPAEGRTENPLRQEIEAVSIVFDSQNSEMPTSGLSDIVEPQSANVTQSRLRVLEKVEVPKILKESM